MTEPSCRSQGRNRPPTCLSGPCGAASGAPTMCTPALFGAHATAAVASQRRSEQEGRSQAPRAIWRPSGPYREAAAEHPRRPGPRPANRSSAARLIGGRGGRVREWAQPALARGGATSVAGGAVISAAATAPPRPAARPVGWAVASSSGGELRAAAAASPFPGDSGRRGRRAACAAADTESRGGSGRGPTEGLSAGRPSAGMAGNAPAAAPPLLLSLLCAAAALLLLPSTGEAAGPDTLMRRPLIPHSPGLLLAQPELLKARVAVAGAGCTSLDGPYGCDVLAVGSGSGGAPEPVHPGRRGGGGLRIHVREGRQSLRAAAQRPGRRGRVQQARGRGAAARPRGSLEGA